MFNPFKAVGAIVKGVGKVAKGAAIAKTKYDILTSDTDGDNKTQIVNMEESATRLRDRAVGNPELKAKGREAELAAEVTTVKLIKAEFAFYKAELTVFSKLVTDHFKAVFAAEKAEQVALLEANKEGGTVA